MFFVKLIDVPCLESERKQEHSAAAVAATRKTADWKSRGGLGIRNAAIYAQFTQRRHKALRINHLQF